MNAPHGAVGERSASAASSVPPLPQSSQWQAPAASLAPLLQFVLGERHWPRAPELGREPTSELTSELTSDLASSLARLAAHLPPLSCAGLEFPLQGATLPQQADLQLGLRSADDAARLLRWLALPAQQPLAAVPAWQAVQRFCAAGLLGERNTELWLELDAVADTDPGANERPPLSVFVRLPAQADAAAAIAEVLQALGLSLPAARGAALAELLCACRAQVRVTHLGCMLGRAGAPMRLIVEGLVADRLEAWLRSLRWHGDGAALRAAWELCSLHGDRLRLALTVDECLRDDLGIEVFIGQRGHDPRWHPALQALVAAGTCSRERSDAVLRWPAPLHPATARAAWPASLICAALLREPGDSGWLDCRISHVKLSLRPDQPLSAKAYLGFVAAWEASAAAVAAVPAAPPRPLRQDGGVDLAAARDTAIAFLLRAQTNSGWWVDYEGFAEGPSDEWVTAYVAAVLARTAAPLARSAAQHAWHLLQRRERQGWGWNYTQAADADSTLWALHLAAALGAETSPRAQLALAFLREHQQADGGLATYRPAHRQLWGGALAVHPSWYATAACVTAAAADRSWLGRQLGVAPLLYLHAHQRADGYWRSDWWSSPWYATAHAAEACAAAVSAAGNAAVGSDVNPEAADRPDTAAADGLARAQAWAHAQCALLPDAPPLQVSRQVSPAVSPAVSPSVSMADTGVRAAAAAAPAAPAPPRSAFELSLALRVLQARSPALPPPPLQPTAVRLLRSLCAQQQDDGSWPASAELSIPNTRGAPILCSDTGRQLTTATVLRALLSLASPHADGRV